MNRASVRGENYTQLGCTRQCIARTASQDASEKLAALLMELKIVAENYSLILSLATPHFAGGVDGIMGTQGIIR